MITTIEVAAGDYEIGDDSLPNAGPKHRRRLRRAFWIDARPVCWEEYEAFVVAGGYRPSELWPVATGAAQWLASLSSVDSRCEALLASALAFRGVSPFGNKPLRSQPITGLTWFEASALAQFRGARIPFEAEWEIAMRPALAARSSEATPPFETLAPSDQCQLAQNDMAWDTFVKSAWGCVSLLGVLQEWTADGFQAKYWRADFDRPGVHWSREGHFSGVSVRGGSANDTHHHLCARMGTDPAEGHAHRGFRRAWDRPPSESVQSTSDRPI